MHGADVIPLLNHLEVAQPNDNPHGLTKRRSSLRNPLSKKPLKLFWELALEVIDESGLRGFTR